jgi:hypothetical protein
VIFPLLLAGYLANGIAYSGTVEGRPAAPAIPVDEATFAKVCTDQNDHLLYRVPLTGEVGYFVKPIVLKGKTYFAITLDQKPVIVDSKGKILVEMDGDNDPLVSFDSKILTVLKHFKNENVVKFYNPKNIERGEFTEILSKMTFSGAYQSIAPLQQDGSDTVYRFAIDSLLKYDKEAHANDPTVPTSAPMFLDFKVTPEGIETLTDFDYPCKSKRLQMPMISKDGTRLGALNLETQTTQIFDISNGKCDMKYDLGFATPKIDFSYDGKKVAFHLSAKPRGDKHGWINIMGANNTSDVFVYELETKKIQQITHNQNRNSYYPAFLPDGTIMHIDAEPIGNTWHSKYSIGVSKIEPTERERAVLPCEVAKPETLQQRLTIGRLLHGICKEYDDLLYDSEFRSSKMYFLLKASELKETDCRSVVESVWKKYEQSTHVKPDQDDIDAIARARYVGSLSKEDLLVACGSLHD